MDLMVSWPTRGLNRNFYHGSLIHNHGWSLGFLGGWSAETWLGEICFCKAGISICFTWKNEEIRCRSRNWVLMCILGKVRVEILCGSSGGWCFPSGILEKRLWWFRRRNVKFPPFGYLQVDILESIILFWYNCKMEIFIYYTHVHVSSHPIFINFS